jgi:hypothetical protein
MVAIQMMAQMGCFDVREVEARDGTGVIMEGCFTCSYTQLAVVASAYFSLKSFSPRPPLFF